VGAAGKPDALADDDDDDDAVIDVVVADNDGVVGVEAADDASTACDHP